MRPAGEDRLAAVREALAGRDAWLVGGALRDRLLGRPTDDLDVVVAREVPQAARELGRALRGPTFPLSEEFGAWRVIAPDRRWHVDLSPLAADTIEGDLLLRDVTVNALAEPLAGGDVLDPSGGLGDLAARRLRMVSEGSLPHDPLRALRLARLACRLGFAIEPATAAAARAIAARVANVSPERVFAELRQIVTAQDALGGLAAVAELGLEPVVLPELAALRGVEQSQYHHLDVHGHTLAVLGAVIDLERDPSALGPHADAAAAVLAEPLSDELTRGQALRFAALFHDIAKPQTRAVTSEGRVTFFGHDARGAEVSRAALERLRTSERLRAFVAALALHHLRLGFLVHERPLPRRTVYRYLRTCDPVEVEVTILSVADRVATRGKNADAAIAAHLDLARELLGEALRWRADGQPAPLVRGDELARELGIAPGPQLGELLAELAAARFAGEIATREQALAHARAQLAA